MSAAADVEDVSACMTPNIPHILLVNSINLRQPGSQSDFRKDLFASRPCQ